MYNSFYQCPFLDVFRNKNSYYRRSPIGPDLSYVRILHASPGASPVDIYINNRKAISNLKYREFTEYLPLPYGRYNIKLFPAGRTTNPIIDTMVDIPPRTILTVAAINKPENIALLPIEDVQMPIQQGKTYLRFVHLSQNAPNVDVKLPDGTELFTDVGYKEITDYIEVNPGTYTVEVFPTGTNQRVLYVPNIRLRPNRFYTVYAVGLVNERPPLQVLIPLDGSSYLKF
jgi:hypothetical protein